MRMRLRFRSSVALVILLWLGSVAAFAQQNAPKKPITHDVYDSWKSIQGTKLSADGTWLAYALTPQDGDSELVVRNLKTNAEIHAPRGRDPIITSDGRFVVFAVVPFKKDVDQARKAKKKPEDMPKNGVGTVNLASGQVTTVAEHVKSFRVPDENPTVVVFLTLPQNESDEGMSKKTEKRPLGTDLVIRELANGAQTTVAEVSEYALSRNGAWLAYAVSSKTPSNDGAFARSLTSGATRTLLSGSGTYKNFAFDGKGARAAFVSDRDDAKAAAPRFKLYQWAPSADAATELALPSSASMVVSENGRIEFSKDGERVFFGTAPPKQAEPPVENDAREPAMVDIWNYKDPELQPMQKVRAEEEKKRTYRAVFHLADTRFAQLAARDMPDVRTGDNNARALGVSNVPYRQLVSWDGNYDDYYLVSLADGTRRKILDKEHFDATLSPGGNYVLYFSADDDNWYTVRATDGQKTNLTKGLGVKFQSETDDRPEHPTPYGQAGWTEGDTSVLLYDRYDIWEVHPDGTGARMLTAGFGRKQQIVFRYSRTDPAQTNQEPEEETGPRRQTEQPVISTARPLLLSAVDDRTKASGFYRASFTSQDRGAGAPGVSDAPTKVVMLDEAFGVPMKARDADVYAFTLSRFEEFPNLWVSSAAFTDMKKVSDANPQQAQYNWGRSELIDYVNADGKHLKAILTKPENFDPSKKYPMLVYIYEQLTNTLHRYVAPAPGGSSINVTRYVSNGYIILQPDIVYDLGYPGQSALKCVLPAVQKVLTMGFVDPQRVGIQGHSWGGYQIAYMITQTNIFRAVEAGAAVGDMFGGYGGIRWGTGMSRAFQYEKTQSRIGVPPWENPLIYMENSPLFWIEKIHTPYLTMANDEDDAVPWQQGIEFFTAMRRLGKEAYMFVYNGEKHGLRQRENQKHWTVHLAEYFDYFFKDAPKPDWMEHGVPYLEKGKRDVSVFYKKSTDRK
ncbi:MAG: S9 family peptidase [Acidobacteria bacterium]|nr:S9 family peptidase [Acidobacteriota bacterium]